MRRNDDRGSNAPRPQVVVHERAQRRTMQVIEVRVRNQNEIDGRKVRDAKARTAKPLQYEQPPGKIGIDQHALSSNLYEEAGMTDESDAQFSVSGEARFVSLPRPRSNR